MVSIGLQNIFDEIARLIELHPAPLYEQASIEFRRSLYYPLWL